MQAIRKLTANFTEAKIDGEIILMRLDTGELLSLADSAAAVWGLIDGQRDLAAILAALSDEFDVGRGELGRDVPDLLRQLADARLIAVG